MAEYLQSAGGRIIRTDIDSGPGVTHLDVTKRRDWEAVIGNVVGDYGRLDGLVNNAAAYFGRRHFWEETDDEFAQLLDVNIMGTWLGLQVGSRAMAANSGGSIVNFSSTSGMMGAPGFAGYGTTRWAVRGLTKHTAADLAPRRIRVNSVHPGGIKGTGMVGPPGTVTEERARAQANPLGRRGTTDDVSAVVTLLLSDDSSWITGREFVIDGGATLTSAV